MTTFIDGKPRTHTDLSDAKRDNDDLHGALATRPVIDQAEGILMAQHRCSPDETFGMLAQASQRDNRKVSEPAAEIVAGVRAG